MSRPIAVTLKGFTTSRFVYQSRYSKIKLNVTSEHSEHNGFKERSKYQNAYLNSPKALDETTMISVIISAVGTDQSSSSAIFPGYNAGLKSEVFLKG